MTGFGAASGEGAGIVVQVEARSVNHRHLQLKTRLPTELGALEPRVDALVRKHLDRGSVTIHVSVTETSTRTASIDRDAAKRYAKELEALAKELGRPPEDRVDVASLLSLPGVVATPPERARSARELKVVLGAVLGALEGLIEMREREGAAMRKDLDKHLGGLRKVAMRIEKRVPTVVRASQEGLKKRVEALLDGRPIAEADLAREIALLADRGDVSEEIARLGSHFDQLEGLFDAGGAVGRQLDFLVQELLRELNTIGSKCGDAKLAHWVVEGKTLVERLREQVQNVE